LPASVRVPVDLAVLARLAFIWFVDIPRAVQPVKESSMRRILGGNYETVRHHRRINV
jgi:hypothetical protein